MTEPIRISGIRAPKPLKHRRGTAQLTTRFFRLKHFAWVVTVAVIAGGIWRFGTPHMLFNYRYLSHPVAGERYYTSCDYIGWNPRTIRPRDGRCPLILFLTNNTDGPRHE